MGLILIRKKIKNAKIKFISFLFDDVTQLLCYCECILYTVIVDRNWFRVISTPYDYYNIGFSKKKRVNSSVITSVKRKIIILNYIYIYPLT